MHNIWAKYNGTYLIRQTKCCFEFTVKPQKRLPHTHFLILYAITSKISLCEYKPSGLCPGNAL